MHNKTIIGTWINSYGSLLIIYAIESNGVIFGEYTSTTGSTGTYPVIGYTEFTPLGDNSNKAIAITIQWKSIHPESIADDSWHWVSAMNGLLYYDKDKPTIQFLHGMTASTPFPEADVDEPGVYTESLVFTKYEDKEKKNYIPLRSLTKDLFDDTLIKKQNIIGNFKNKNPESSFVSINNLVSNSEVGITGILSIKGLGQVIVHGFADENDTPQSLNAIAFCGTYKLKTSEGIPKTYTISFTGFIDKNSNNQMNLQTFISKKTLSPNKYAAVSIGKEVFVAV